ncbi:MAG: toluene tolerance family protein [Rhizorhabdus sp.]|nr:toluene tolerance family protein [Rhizorhabdus sp.]
MNKFLLSLGTAAIIGTATLVAPVMTAPAAAAVNNQDPAAFITSLSDEALGILRSSDKVAAKAKFRSILTQHFAIDAIGDRLIRRWAAQITPAQNAQYKAAIPNFIVGTYADNLWDYSHATVKVIRTTPAGSGVNVTTQVQKPGAQPITAVWSVAKIGDGFKVTNLTVANINLAVTQGQDFDAIIQRKGFDGLLAMMKSRG